MAEDVFGSDMPADNKYGQNSYLGPSSVTPGKSAPQQTIKAVAGDPAAAAAQQRDTHNRSDFVKRAVNNGESVPTAHGHRNRADDKATHVKRHIDRRKV